MGSRSEVALVLMGLYVSMGNALALQYGGSATHNTVTTPPPPAAATQWREALGTVVRSLMLA